MTTQEAKRPVPIVDAATKPFFDGAREGKLMLQRCGKCRAWHMPLRQSCDECLSLDLEWAPSSGKGEVYTFAYMHYVFHPGFAKEVPYNLTVVKLDEGPVMETVLVGVKHGDIKVGQRVEAVFEDVGGTFVPKFKLAAKR